MKRALLLVFLLGISTTTALSQIPHTLSYQGVLTDASGTPVPDGPINITFRLYDVSGGGSPLWEETQQVTVNKGVFGVVLGTVTPLNLPFDKPYWLGMTVGQGTELAPRSALTASPYSLNSPSTIAEPAPGQGLTIRDSSGTPTHTLYAGGGAVHTGKTVIQMPAAAGFDTALAIYGSGGPAFVAVQNDSGTAPPPGLIEQGKKKRTPREGLTRPSSVELFPIYAIRGSSPYGIGVGGFSRIGDGVYGSSYSGLGVNGYSSTGTGVYGESAYSVGVWGYSVDESGVYGESDTFPGVEGNSLTGPGVFGKSSIYAGVYGEGLPAGYFEGQVLITQVDPDPAQERVLVWSSDNVVRYKTISGSGSGFDGILVGQPLVLKTSSGTEVFRVDTTGASLHKGDETFEGDVILKGTNGKGAKLVDSTGETLAGFGRKDLDTGQRIGVFGKAQKPGDLAGAFEGDVDVNGEVYVTSLHVIRAQGDTVVHFNQDGTSEHMGLETYRAGLQTVLNNGNILRMNPAEGMTLKTAQGEFLGHMDPNGNGYFAGNVTVAGNLSKGGGSFKIDHPLDPANKYLYHSFVESPDMKDIYDGVVVLDTTGEATVDLPDWFEALNRTFRYQLTAIGTPAPNLYVSGKIEGNHFAIAGGVPGMEVSWQVTGVRQDAYAEKHRIPVEVMKPAAERGRYLHPDAFGLSPADGISLSQMEDGE